MAQAQTPIKSAELVVLPENNEALGRSEGLDVRTFLHTLPQGKGSVFGLITIEHKDELARERIIHIVQSHLEHLAADLADEANPARRFEQALARINRDLGKTARQMQMAFERLRAVVGIVVKGQIFISGIGTLQAIFLHKTAENRFVIYELDAQFEDREERTWDKPFTAVLDGELHPNDVLYVATPVTHSILGIHELQDILVTLPPAGALERVQQFLPTTEPYGAVCFRAFEPDISGVTKANPIGSLNELSHTQSRTATVLGDHQPDFIGNIKEAANKLRKKLRSPGARGVVVVAKKIAGVIIHGLALIFTGLLSGLKFIGQKIQDIVQARRSRMSLKKGVGHRSRTGKTNFPFSWRALALVGVLVIALVIVVIILPNGGGQNKTDEVFAQNVEGIEGYILAAQASLIYNNTEEAQRNLDDALSTLETMPQDTAEHLNAIALLEAELAALAAEINGITLIKPTLVGDLRQTETTANILSVTGTTRGLVSVTDTLGVYRLDLATAAWLKDELTNGPLARVTNTVATSENILALDTTEQLARANFTTKTFNLITSGTPGMASVEDIFIYNETLYALTALDQQIVKMRAQGENYEAGTPWITARSHDLSTARALAVDSDIYILLADTVTRFTSGRESTWAPASISPALTNPTDLWTTFESKYLYILDPAETRVIVIEKETGAITAQYVAEEFAGAVGFAIDENTKKITIVTSTEAWEFTPQHLVK